MMRIQQQQQRVVDDAVPPGIHHSSMASPASRSPRQRACESRQSSSLISCPSGRNQQILDFGATDLPSMEKLAAAQDRMLVKHLDQPPGKGQELAPWPIQRPVHPGQLVVLAIGVVVLGPPEFVAGEQHRHALREE